MVDNDFFIHHVLAYIEELKKEDPTNTDLEGYRQVSLYAAVFGHIDVVSSAASGRMTSVGKWSALRKMIENQVVRARKARPGAAKGDKPQAQAPAASQSSQERSHEALKSAEPIAGQYFEFIKANPHSQAVVSHLNTARVFGDAMMKVMPILAQDSRRKLKARMINKKLMKAHIYFYI